MKINVSYMSFLTKKSGIKDLFKIMKICLLLLFVFTFQMMAHDTKAQDAVIDLKKSTITVGQLITEIERQTDYLVVYSNREIDTEREIHLQGNAEKVSILLSKAFSNTDIGYDFENNYIVLSKKASRNANTVITPIQSNQQKKTVTGRVTDENGEPIIGANVVEKGTTNGTVTDIDGTFSLRVEEDAVLHISYIGFVSQDIKIKNRTNFDFILVEETEALQEVVVVGYGVQNKRDVSTAISSVKAEKLENKPITDLRESLAGRMAGVQVMQAGGGPEGKLSIRIRGTSTITAGNEPLYVVDGVPMDVLIHLNANDVESIEVLKDASAAAIYGSRGSNGVVLITTKNGKAEKLEVQYDGHYGFQKLSKKLPMLNAYQYAKLAKDAHDNAYLDEVPTGSADDPNSVRKKGYQKVPEELFPYLEGVPGLTDTDWQDEIYRTAPTVSHNLSVSQKRKTTDFYISGNYFKQEGIIICSDIEKYSARLNLDSHFNKIKVGVNFSPTYSKANVVNSDSQYSGGGVVASALGSLPIWPVYNEDGSFNFDGNGKLRINPDYQHSEILNPVAIARLVKNEVDRITLGGRMYFEYEFFEGLSYNVSAGGEFYTINANRYTPSTLQKIGKNYYGLKADPVASADANYYYNWLVENKLSYTKSFNDHYLNAIFVQSAQKATHKTLDVTGTGHPTDHIEIIPDGGGVTLTSGSSNESQWSLASYLARVQYNYQGKYMASAAIRADGSSRFGTDSRWGYFPSASAAWRISDESFFKAWNNKSIVSDLKLRTSIGVTGNFNIGNYDHLSTVNTSEAYILGAGDGSVFSAYSPAKAENRRLRWEKSVMMNAGIDLVLLNGLLGLTAEYYNNNTKDLLLTVPIPRTAGYNSALMNIGKVNNRGWELQVSSQKQFRDFGYNLSANISTNRNEVIALGPENADIISTGSTSNTYYLTRVGERIGNYYLLVQDGIFSTEEQLLQYPHFDDTHVGDFRFVDVDGDGILDVEKDRAVVGNYMPDFTYGGSLGFNYKGIDLGLDFQGVYGNEIIHLNRRYYDNITGNFNGTTVALDRWVSESEPGNGKVNRANRKTKGNNGVSSTWHVEDGSFWRLQNITLGYTIPRNITTRININRLRAFVSGKNMVTITNYSGYNPEVNRRTGSALTPGEDYGSYPLAKVVTFGLSITF
jgi:TonB-linked SusC/RagA family outer membrane protein